MSIELVYGFVDISDSTHIHEEELLVEYGINLYSLEVSNGKALKACYGIPLNLDQKIVTSSQIYIDSKQFINILSSDDIESIDKLYKKFLEYHKNTNIVIPSIGLHIVYSTTFQFESKPYSLKSGPKPSSSSINETTEENQSDEESSNKETLEPLAEIFKQAQAHIEEQISTQKCIIEYLKSIEENSRYKFKLVHNLPGKDFLLDGKITLKYDFQIFDGDKLVHHVKIVSSGLYTISDGYVENLTQPIIVSNNNFVPDDEFLGELESWIYLFDDNSMFDDLIQPLHQYYQNLVDE